MKKRYGVFLGFAVLLCAAAFLFAACADTNNSSSSNTTTPPEPPAASKFVAGTYSGSGRGYNATPIVLDVTVDADKITAITVTSNNESNNSQDGSTTNDRTINAANYPLAVYASVGAAWPNLKTLFVDRDSSKLTQDDLDAFSGASYSTKGFSLAVADALEQATISWQTGTFSGSGFGYSNRSGTGTDIALSVTLDATGITAITVTEHQESTGVDYPETGMGSDNGASAHPLVKQGFDSLAGTGGETSVFAGAISSNVDVTSSATYTWRGFRLAVAEALDAARQ